jgi:hypothetical protein
MLIAYVTAIVWGLNKIEVWTPSLLKDTVIWLLFSGLALAFSFVSSNLDKGILRRIVTDNLKVIVILEFIIEEYTFSLPVELILIPFMAIVAALDVIAKTNQKHAAVARLTTGVQVLFGLFIVMFAVVHAVTDFHELATVDSIRRVLLIPILSVSLAPYIYVLLVLTNYELLFVRLKMNSQKEPGVARYAKWRLVNHLRMRPRRIRDFLRAHAVDLMHLRTKADVDKLMKAASGHSSMPH